MTDSRYTSPIPPYQQGGGPQDQGPIEGVVLDGSGRTSPAGSASGPYVGGGSGTGLFTVGPFGVRAYGLGPQGAPRFVRQKSLFLAALLAFAFPPLGMLYATFFGTFVMIVASIPVAIVTGGQGLAALWPVCVVWAVWAAHRKNQRRLAWAATGF